MTRPICLPVLLLVVSFSLSVAHSAEEPSKTYEEACQEGRQHLAKGRLKDAIDSYTKAIGEIPSEPLALVSRGLVYCATQEYEKAKLDAERALALDPENLDARLVLATSLRLMKQYKEAEEVFNHAIYEIDGRSANAYAGRGMLYVDMHDDQRAERDFSKAISLSPKFENAYLERAAIYMRSGREIGQAIRDYSTVIEDLEKATPEYHYLRARALLEAERYDEAIDDAREVVKAVPDYVAAHGVLVVALFKQQKYDKADEALKRAEYYAEAEPGVLLWRGLLLATEEKYEEALAKYQEALKTDADFLPALKASIHAYEALEDNTNEDNTKVETLQAEVERIEAEQKQREKDEHLLWAVVQGIPGASRDLTDERSREIAERKARDEEAKQLARQYAEEVRKNTRSLQKDCQEIEIAEVVPVEWDFAEESVKTASKRFDEEEYELAGADFKQGQVRYHAALDAYEAIVSKDSSLWKKWAFERAENMDDDYAPVITWLALAEACHRMGDASGYERSINRAVAMTNSTGLLNPQAGCSSMLRISRLQVECGDMEGAADAVRAAADFCEGMSSKSLRASSLAQCAGAAIRCDKRELWPVYLAKAVQAAEQSEFSRKEYRARHVDFVKYAAYMEARSTEEAFSYAQNVEQIVARSANDSDVRWNADVYAGVAYTAMKSGCSTEKERQIFEASYLKSIGQSVTKSYGRDFAVGARYVLALADAAGNDYLRSWCGTMVLADFGAVALVGGKAIRVACEQGRLGDARTMYGAFMESYPSAEAARYLADAEARLGRKSFVELRHWVHDMPQNATRAAALIGLSAGVKAGRTADGEAETESPTQQAEQADVSPEDILKLRAGGEPERAMEMLAKQLKDASKKDKKKLMAVFDSVAADAPAWWLKQAQRRIGQIEEPHVRASLWLQIAKMHLAARDRDAYRAALAEINSCWIAMWTRIYTRRCPPNRGNDGSIYWEFDNDLEELEVAEIRTMLRVLFDIEEIQTGLGETKEAMETLLLAARCAELMPRKSGFTAALTPSYTTLWLNRVGGRLRLRGREDLATIMIDPSPGTPGIHFWPINWYKQAQAAFEAQDLDELGRLVQVCEERSHSGADFIYTARVSALLALAAAKQENTSIYRKAAMQAASLMKRGSRDSSAPVLCDLARAAVAADMPDIASDYMEQASRYYEDRALVLTEIAQALAKKGKIEKAEELSEGLRSDIPEAAAYHAIVLAKASQSKENLSKVYEDIEYYYEPSAQAAGYTAVAEALLSK